MFEGRLDFELTKDPISYPMADLSGVRYCEYFQDILCVITKPELPSIMKNEIWISAPGFYHW